MYLYFLQVFPEGLVATDGRLQPGDQIIEINGADMTCATHAQVSYDFWLVVVLVMVVVVVMVLVVMVLEVVDFVVMVLVVMVLEVVVLMVILAEIRSLSIET